MAVARNSAYENNHFVVEIDGIEPIGFTDVTLPEMTVEVIEHRDGSDLSAGSRKAMGRTSFGPAILQRGFDGKLDLSEWWTATSSGEPQARRNVSIQLLDEEMNPVAQWRLLNAWPAKYVVSDLKADANEIMIETLEIVCERVVLE